MATTGSTALRGASSFNPRLLPPKSAPGGHNLEPAAYGPTRATVDGKAHRLDRAAGWARK